MTFILKLIILANYQYLLLRNLLKIFNYLLWKLNKYFNFTLFSFIINIYLFLCLVQYLFNHLIILLVMKLFQISYVKI
jgi:hypothetical protein